MFENGVIYLTDVCTSTICTSSIKVHSHMTTATAFFLSSQLDFMVTSGAVHIALALVTATETATLQMNGFHTHSL